MLCGWLSPDGEFYVCDPYGHISLADKLVRELYETTYSGRFSTDDFLIHNNWVKLYRDGIAHNTENIFDRKCHILTSKQFVWLSNNTLSARQHLAFSNILECESGRN